MSTPQDPFRPAPSADQPQWSAAPPPGYGPPPQGYSQDYGQAPVHTGPSQTSSRAIIALVLAIGSFVVFPLVPAIVALVLVPGAREEIDLSGGRVSGDGLLTAAKIISWVNIGLCIAGVVLMIAAFALFATVGFS